MAKLNHKFGKEPPFTSRDRPPPSLRLSPPHLRDDIGRAVRDRTSIRAVGKAEEDRLLCALSFSLSLSDKILFEGGCVVPADRDYTERAQGGGGKEDEW